jgi:murein DD-endopeptidase MepM/ murein hydrolase activator NlpD
VDALLARDDSALTGMMSEAGLAAMPGFSATSLMDELEQNRLSFEAPEFGAYFEATFTGEQQMKGLYIQGSLTGFSLETEEPQTPDGPSGVWTGTIGGSLPISVNFGGGSEGTPVMEVLDQQVSTPVANVQLDAERPVGEQLTERSLPVGGAGNHFGSAQAWGVADLVISIGVDADGLVNGITTAPQYPLPPDPAAGYESKIEYRIPADGPWLVYWGGDTEFQNYHAVTPNQRHAYDLVIWQEGASFHGDGTKNEDYHAFGQPALAPASGTVVEVENGMPDMKPGELLAALPPEEQEGLHPAGNHVIIQTDEQEFVLIAHMAEGSVQVAVGDTVQIGDRIGTVGNSGNTSESHLHVHVQNQADFFAPDTFGLPLAFSNLTVDGESTEGKVAPIQGQIVQS